MHFRNRIFFLVNSSIITLQLRNVSSERNANTLVQLITIQSKVSAHLLVSKYTTQQLLKSHHQNGTAQMVRKKHYLIKFTAPLQVSEQPPLPIHKQ